MQTLSFDAPNALPVHERLRLGVHDWLTSKVEEIISVCDLFLAGTHRELLCKEPSSDLLREHREASNLLLRMTRRVLEEVQSSPLGNGSLGRNLSSRIRVMEAHHDTLHNPMPAAEAEAMLAQAFPDAPRP